MAEKKRSVKGLVHSMPTPLQNVIELGGRWTKIESWIFLILLFEVSKADASKFFCLCQEIYFC